MLLFIGARLMSGPSGAGTGQWVPLGQMGKAGKIGHHLLSHASFPLLSPFCEGVGKGLSKEQRKRKRVIGGEEKKAKRSWGWVRAQWGPAS